MPVLAVMYVPVMTVMNVGLYLRGWVPEKGEKEAKREVLVRNVGFNRILWPVLDLSDRL